MLLRLTISRTTKGLNRLDARSKQAFQSRNLPNTQLVPPIPECTIGPAGILHTVKNAGESMPVYKSESPLQQVPAHCYNLSDEPQLQKTTRGE